MGGGVGGEEGLMWKLRKEGCCTWRREAELWLRRIETVLRLRGENPPLSSS